MTTTKKTWSILAAGLVVGAWGGCAAASSRSEAPTEPRLAIRFENSRVRVLELHLKPGERETLHTHPQYVLYALTDYRVRNFKADGASRIFERKAGDVYWGEPITHGGENIGKTDVRAVIVELKDSVRK